MKKFFALLLALTLVLSLGTAAFAANDGSIEISAPVTGHTYDYYEILVLESYNSTSGAYAYKADADWLAFLKSATAYVTVNAQNYVTWVKDADAAAFAKLALAYAKDNSIAADGTLNAENSFKATGLELGYYLVDSSLGTICSLDTADTSAVIEEKNSVSSNEKTVKEDSTGLFGAANDADVGQTVNFKSTITVGEGSVNYVFHDEMSSGLTWDGSVVVSVGTDEVDAKNYTLVSEPADDCTFEVAFDNAYIAGLAKGTEIVIAYSALVNAGAVVGSAGNPNTSFLQYGDAGKTTNTPDSTTITRTWSVDVFKYTLEEDAKVAVADAVFTLSKNADGSNPIALVDLGNNVYRVAVADEDNTVTEITTPESGEFTIKGLDSDTYYLTETGTPKGFNKLAGPVVFSINANGEVLVDNTVVDSVDILNEHGILMPSTGGIGTTLFYAFGGMMVIAAAVLLITKKRMASEA